MKSNPARARARAVAVIATLTASGCDFHGDPLVILPEFDDTATFETKLDDWIPGGIDLSNPTDSWEVARSTDRASAGTQSVRLRLDNLNARGKIFLERRYAVAKDQLYAVEVTFDFASADWTGVSAWQLLAGVGPDSPTKTGTTTSLGTTANGGAAPGWVWIPKIYVTEARSDADGELYLYVGVWGTSPFFQSYYVDNLKVVLTRKGISTDRR